MKPWRACPEAALTMRPPPPWVRIRAAAAWQHKKVPVVLTRRTRSQSSSRSSSSRLIVMIPALLTSTSTRSAAWKSLATSAGTVMSAWTPTACSSSAAWWTASLRSASTSRAPSAAKRDAMPLPMPPPAPVMTTVRPSKRDMGVLLLQPCARHGGVPGADARMPGLRGLLGLVELTRPVERLERAVRPDPGHPAREMRDAERGELGRQRPRDGASARVGLQLHQRAVGRRAAVGQQGLHRARVGLDGGDRVLDLKGDRLQRGARDLRQPRGEGQSADQTDGLLVPPRRRQAAEG